MKYDILLLSAIFVPLLGAFLLPLAGKLSSKLRNGLSLCFIATPFVLSLILLTPALNNQPILVNQPLVLGLNFAFAADGLAVFMACASSLISTIVVFYSFGYISHYENQNEYYLMVTLFLGAMMGLVFAANLIWLYLFWEITAVASWRLIGFFREKTHVIRADKAFLVTAFGALAMLIGFVMIYQQTGSFDLWTLKEFFKTNTLSSLAACLILVGILSKSATLPFHTWLPDAGVAPSPVTALLHAAVLVKIGVYVFARLFIATFSLDAFWQIAVPVIAAISMLVSASAALRETDLKRIIAYSTVSQIGFIFFGLAIGNPLGVAGGLLYILMHGLAKGGLFLCAGIIEQNTKTKDITKMGGLISAMPVTAISFLFCAFSVMGIPPFGGFFSKYMVFSAGIQSGHLWITAVFLFGAFLTLLYLFRVFHLVFLGEAQIRGVKEGSATMIFSVAMLAGLSLLAGLFISYPAHFVQVVVSQMTGIVL